jgi:hypothetical protein
MAATRERITVICAVIYGTFVLIAVAPMYLFSFQQHQPLLMRIAGGAYTLTLLPAALVGFISKRTSGLWMLLVSVLAICALWLREIVHFLTAGGVLNLLAGLAWWAIVGAIPGVMGIILLKPKRA